MNKIEPESVNEKTHNVCKGPWKYQVWQKWATKTSIQLIWKSEAWAVLWVGEADDLTQLHTADQSAATNKPKYIMFQNNSVYFPLIQLSKKIPG